jgi:hypothetical protein
MNEIEPKDTTNRGDSIETLRTGLTTMGVPFFTPDVGWTMPDGQIMPDSPGLGQLLKKQFGVVAMAAHGTKKG